jgi:hypothetical protein
MRRCMFAGVEPELTHNEACHQIVAARRIRTRAVLQVYENKI